MTQRLTNPNYIVEQVLSLYKEVLGAKDLKLDVRFGKDVEDILLDPERFEQVVRNLVSNAIDASPVGGTIHIGTGVSHPSSRALETAAMESESYFEMRIRNHGPAIKETDLQRIFSPFFTTKDYGQD